MRKWLRFKKQKNTEPSLEEKLKNIKKERENKIEKISISIEKERKELKENHYHHLQQLHKSEREVTVKELLLDAIAKKHPIIYEILDDSERYRKYRYTRGKASSNPLEILTDEHPNCMFLKVWNKETEEVAISLYYDKVLLKFIENKWKEQYDFALKYQLRSFLYELMAKAMKKNVSIPGVIISEFKEEEKLLTGESEMDKKYQLAVQQIEEKEKVEKQKIRDEYREKINELERNIQNSGEEGINYYEKKEIPFNKERKRTKPFYEGMVYQKEVADKMNSLYFRLIELLDKEKLMEHEDSYELRNLYEKEIQFIWREYTKLDERKQEKEKERLYALLEAVFSRLNEIEEKLKQMEQWDYEKKMLFMEKKYANYF